MIVSVLSRRVGAVVVVMIVTARRGMVVAMFGGFLIVMVVLTVLRNQDRWRNRAEGQRRQYEDYRLPGALLHGDVLVNSTTGLTSINIRRAPPTRDRRNPMSVETYA